MADEARGILVPRGPWTTRPAAGSRVVLEGQLRMGEGAIPTMIVSRVVSVAPGKVPDAVLIEAGELTQPRFLGQRVQLKAQLQALTPATDRVRITATSRAIQYDIDAHGIARGLLTGFLGAQVRVSGAVWPARIGPSGEPLGRLGLSSIGDLDDNDTHRRILDETLTQWGFVPTLAAKRAEPLAAWLNPGPARASARRHPGLRPASSRPRPGARLASSRPVPDLRRACARPRPGAGPDGPGAADSMAP